MKFKHFPFFLSEVYTSFRMHILPTCISIMTIMLALTTLGLMVGGSLNLGRLTNAVRSQAEISIYLKESLSDDGAWGLTGKIRDIPGVRTVHLVNKQQALGEMTGILGNSSEILTAFDGLNPFAAYLEVTVIPEQAGEIAQKAIGLPGVDAVRDNRELLTRLIKLSTVLLWIGLVVVGAVGLLTMVVVSHIVRLGIDTRRDEMEILRLLGASNSFVAAPFILEAMVIGGLGSLLAFSALLGLLPGISSLLKEALPFFPLVPWSQALGPIALVVGALGFGFAALGGFISVRSH
ncbi:MAG: cell division protein FtsX [Bacillota bacterium]